MPSTFNPCLLLNQIINYKKDKQRISQKYNGTFVMLVLLALYITTCMVKLTVVQHLVT